MTPESRDHYIERGWAWHRNLVDASDAADIGSDLMRELGAHEGPLLRVLTSRDEPHRRDASGRITNPVIHPGRLDSDLFPACHGVEQRLFDVGPVVAWAAELMGEPVALLQSGWWPSSVGTPWHRDTNPIDASAPMLGMWVALEDIVRDAGPFVVFDGSHRLSGGEVGPLMTASDALYRRQYVDHEALDAHEVARVHAGLTAALAASGSGPVMALLRCGDAIVWDARAVHGSETPRPGPATRNSLLLHFVPLRSVLDRNLQRVG